jgi:hypothetical protein
MARLHLLDAGWSVLTLTVVLLVVVEDIKGEQRTLEERSLEWVRAVAATRPDHWYTFEVSSVKEGAPDMGVASNLLPGVFSGNVVLSKPGLVGRAVAICGGRSGVLLADRGPRKSISSPNWSISFLILNYGAPAQASEELMRENIQHNEPGTSALKMRQFRTSGM